MLIISINYSIFQIRIRTYWETTFEFWCSEGLQTKETCGWVLEDIWKRSMNFLRFWETAQIILKFAQFWINLEILCRKFRITETELRCRDAEFSRVGCPFEGKKHAPVIFFLNWTLDIQIRCQVYYQLLTFRWETWQRSTVWALLWLNSAFYSLNLPLKA